MTERARRGTGLLVAGGVLSALNGASHFVLPVAYPPGGWAPRVEGLYEPVRWALYSGNVFFGVLLVLGGALSVAVARSADVPRRIVGWVAAGMAGFWVLAAVYEVVVPFPIPEAQLALPAFSLVVAGLYLAGVWVRLRSGSRPGRSSRRDGGWRHSSTASRGRTSQPAASAKFAIHHGVANQSWRRRPGAGR